MPPDRGYKEARKQIEWHFGNKAKMMLAFMDKTLKWPTIKAEDALGLRFYAISLKSCHDTMQELKYVTELETPSNLAIIVFKLRIKLRDKWRAVQNKHQRRATFRDLFAFIYNQSRTMLDPFFEEISKSVLRAKPQIQKDTAQLI